MSKLAAALTWAARGFRVFPIAEGTKDQPLVAHSTEATTDFATVQAWWKDPLTGAERAHNIGIATTDMVVVDLDNKKGKQGFANYLAIGGTLDTFCVRTPTGGLHLYYTGPDSATVAGFLGKESGVDIRSHGGYVVAAGSYTLTGPRSVEGAYTVELDMPLAGVPICVATRLRRPLVRNPGDVSLPEETPALVERAKAFLAATAPLAMQGAAGDDTTYQVACRLRDLGLGEFASLALLLSHWNERCQPPWDADELAVKVANAYAYATGTAGSMTAEVLFKGIEIPPVPAPPAIDTASVFRFGNAVDGASIPARPWLYNRLLMRQQITLLSAAGATGKSTLALTVAAHLAMGITFMGYELAGPPQRSIVYNHEDDVVEQSRRLWAICKQFGFPFETVRDRIALLSRKELALRVTENDPPTINMAHVKSLVEAASAPDVGLIAAGPFVSLHTANEDDNVAMSYVMEVLHAVVEAADVAGLIDHHISKSSGNVSRAGDAYAARGAGAIVYAARMSFTLWSPTKDECADVGIPADKRFEFVRLDDAKMNFSLQAGRPNWMHKRGVRTPAGDDVGVLVPYDMRGATDALTMSWATLIAAEMMAKGRASCTLNEAADMLKAGDQLMAKLTAGVLRARVRQALSSARATTHGLVTFTRVLHDGKLRDTIVLE